jgi:hypothetical protein
VRGVFEFDPNLHPRDAHGHFADKLKGLKIGHETHLPDGILVKAVPSRSGGRSTRRFQVKQPPGDMHAALSNMMHNVDIAASTHPSAEQAARNALDRSARSNHPGSIGGTERYRSYDHFVREGDLGPEAKQPRAQPTGKPHPRKRHLRVA